jgi:hypothetical protein
MFLIARQSCPISTLQRIGTNYNLFDFSIVIDLVFCSILVLDKRKESTKEFCKSNCYDL